MSAQKGTISANDETVGPVSIRSGQMGMVTVDHTAGTITLQYNSGDAWIDVETGYTADTVKMFEGFGEFRLIGTGSPNAVCTIGVQ